MMLAIAGALLLVLSVWLVFAVDGIRRERNRCLALRKECEQLSQKLAAVIAAETDSRTCDTRVGMARAIEIIENEMFASEDCTEEPEDCGLCKDECKYVLKSPFVEDKPESE